eukprot:TRINITY_DN2454_c0_g1_i1.p1 TRINITY_DN2454_c0_g1~~TRINITY_DN2454_c0_g1_i1.p1  ORF type:complete len:2489 (+),score=650.76 TRINITY_DN2454_c0_g1_i1:5195-12661(+)
MISRIFSSEQSHMTLNFVEPESLFIKVDESWYPENLVNSVQDLHEASTAHLLRQLFQKYFVIAYSLVYTENSPLDVYYYETISPFQIARCMCALIGSLIHQFIGSSGAFSLPLPVRTVHRIFLYALFNSICRPVPVECRTKVGIFFAIGLKIPGMPEELMKQINSFIQSSSHGTINSSLAGKQSKLDNALPDDIMNNAGIDLLSYSLDEATSEWNLVSMLVPDFNIPAVPENSGSEQVIKQLGNLIPHTPESYSIELLMRMLISARSSPFVTNPVFPLIFGGYQSGKSSTLESLFSETKAGVATLKLTSDHTKTLFKEIEKFYHSNSTNSYSPSTVSMLNLFVLKLDNINLFSDTYNEGELSGITLLKKLVVEHICINDELTEITFEKTFPIGSVTGTGIGNLEKRFFSKTFPIFVELQTVDSSADVNDLNIASQSVVSLTLPAVFSANRNFKQEISLNVMPRLINSIRMLFKALPKIHKISNVPITNSDVHFVLYNLWRLPVCDISDIVGVFCSSLSIVLQLADVKKVEELFDKINQQLCLPLNLSIELMCNFKIPLFHSTSTGENNGISGTNENLIDSNTSGSSNNANGERLFELLAMDEVFYEAIELAPKMKQYCQCYSEYDLKFAIFSAVAYLQMDEKPIIFGLHDFTNVESPYLIVINIIFGIFICAARYNQLKPILACNYVDFEEIIKCLQTVRNCVLIVRQIDFIGWTDKQKKRLLLEVTKSEMNAKVILLFDINSEAYRYAVQLYTIYSNKLLSMSVPLLHVKHFFPIYIEEVKELLGVFMKYNIQLFNGKNVDDVVEDLLNTTLNLMELQGKSYYRTEYGNLTAPTLEISKSDTITDNLLPQMSMDTPKSKDKRMGGSNAKKNRRNSTTIKDKKKNPEKLISSVINEQKPEVDGELEQFFNKMKTFELIEQSSEKEFEEGRLLKDLYHHPLGEPGCDVLSANLSDLSLIVTVAEIASEYFSKLTDFADSQHKRHVDLLSNITLISKHVSELQESITVLESSIDNKDDTINDITERLIENSALFVAISEKHNAISKKFPEFNADDMQKRTSIQLLEGDLKHICDRILKNFNRSEHLFSNMLTRLIDCHDDEPSWLLGNDMILFCALINEQNVELIENFDLAYEGFKKIVEENSYAKLFEFINVTSGKPTYDKLLEFDAAILKKFVTIDASSHFSPAELSTHAPSCVPLLRVLKMVAQAAGNVLQLRSLKDQLKQLHIDKDAQHKELAVVSVKLQEQEQIVSKIRVELEVALAELEGLRRDRKRIQADFNTLHQLVKQLTDFVTTLKPSEQMLSETQRISFSFALNTTFVSSCHHIQQNNIFDIMKKDLDSNQLSKFLSKFWKTLYQQDPPDILFSHEFEDCKLFYFNLTGIKSLIKHHPIIVSDPSNILVPSLASINVTTKNIENFDEIYKYLGQNALIIIPEEIILEKANLLRRITEIVLEAHHSHKVQTLVFNDGVQERTINVSPKTQLCVRLTSSNQLHKFKYLLTHEMTSPYHCIDLSFDLDTFKQKVITKLFEVDAEAFIGKSSELSTLLRKIHNKENSTLEELFGLVNCLSESTANTSSQENVDKLLTKVSLLVRLDEERTKANDELKHIYSFRAGYDSFAAAIVDVYVAYLSNINKSKQNIQFVSIQKFIDTVKLFALVAPPAPLGSKARSTLLFKQLAQLIIFISTVESDVIRTKIFIEFSLLSLKRKDEFGYRIFEGIFKKMFDFDSVTTTQCQAFLPGPYTTMFCNLYVQLSEDDEISKLFTDLTTSVSYDSWNQYFNQLITANNDLLELISHPPFENDLPFSISNQPLVWFSILSLVHYQISTNELKYPNLLPILHQWILYEAIPGYSVNILSPSSLLNMHFKFHDAQTDFGLPHILSLLYTKPYSFYSLIKQITTKTGRTVIPIGISFFDDYSFNNFLTKEIPQIRKTHAILYIEGISETSKEKTLQLLKALNTPDCHPGFLCVTPIYLSRIADREKFTDILKLNDYYQIVFDENYSPSVAIDEMQQIMSPILTDDSLTFGIRNSSYILTDLCFKLCNEKKLPRNYYSIFLSDAFKYLYIFLSQRDANAMPLNALKHVLAEHVIGSVYFPEKRELIEHALQSLNLTNLAEGKNLLEVPVVDTEIMFYQPQYIYYNHPAVNYSFAESDSFNEMLFALIDHGVLHSHLIPTFKYPFHSLFEVNSLQYHYIQAYVHNFLRKLPEQIYFNGVLNYSMSNINHPMTIWVYNEVIALNSSLLKIEKLLTQALESNFSSTDRYLITCFFTDKLPLEFAPRMIGDFAFVKFLSSSTLLSILSVQRNQLMKIIVEQSYDGIDISLIQYPKLFIQCVYNFVGGNNSDNNILDYDLVLKIDENAFDIGQQKKKKTNVNENVTSVITLNGIALNPGFNINLETSTIMHSNKNDFTVLPQMKLIAIPKVFNHSNIYFIDSNEKSGNIEIPLNFCASGKKFVPIKYIAFVEDSPERFTALKPSFVPYFRGFDTNTPGNYLVT